MPFIGTLGDIKDYNMAYYGAQSSLERSLLVLRYQWPWFNGEGWTATASSTGPVSDLGSGFSFFSDPWNEMYWKIIGRGPLVPMSGLWNVESAFLSGSSNDFNMLDYATLNKIILWYDSTVGENAYALDTNAVQSSGVSVSVLLRLNPITYQSFDTLWDGNLCESCDTDGDGVDNDVVVDRWWKWLYDDSWLSWTFSIFPYQDVFYNNGLGTVQGLDQAVRESYINDPEEEILVFWGAGSYNYNPINPTFWGLDDTQHLMITDNNSLSWLSFQDLLTDGVVPSVNSQAISLGIVNPLTTIDWSIYPFIEYKVLCSGCGDQNWESQLSQPYFYITAQSKVWDYDVKMQLVRGADQDAFVSSFTVIF